MNKIRCSEGSKHFTEIENVTSTPKSKRRRLGTNRILRPSIDVFQANLSPMNPCNASKSPERLCESPLPCNQIEYLCSSNNSSGYSNLKTVSPRCTECSTDMISKEFNSTFFTAKSKSQKQAPDLTMYKEQGCEEEISFDDNMFNSELIIPDSTADKIEDNHLVQTSLRQKIENSFQLINQSICTLEAKNNIKEDDLFETKDSFLLDIKESALEEEVKQKREINDTFYGLPMITKELFKTYRNIEKFYDWQEECLNLCAIKERRNLIYSLPTSGGKTLVAEVLMLREVLNRQKNTLFILPFVAIVQEKIWALSPFALQLNFLVEEYAGGKGHIPPKRRRNKNSIYIATIEKGLALIRSLIELERLDEIGLIVVDELHLIGESGRGGTLEMLLTTVIFANKNIQIVGMSATIGNLREVATFLRADVFERQFRPVELTEYVKFGNMLHRIVWNGGDVDIVPERELKFNYTSAALALDGDFLGGLVSEVAPRGSVLVFCPTKRSAENVARLLCTMHRQEMSSHRVAERQALEAALAAEGAGAELRRVAARGVAFHHAGLAGDERALVEAAFRSGVVSVLCCTSTLAAGVNLPASRVVVRAPLVGRDPLTLATYRQMAGRAGRAGKADTGDSILICSESERSAVVRMLRGGVDAARSQLPRSLPALLLSCVALRLASTRAALRRVMQHSLMAVQRSEDETNIKEVCDETIRSLIRMGALEVKQTDMQTESRLQIDDKCYVGSDTELIVSAFGNAAIKGCLELGAARSLYRELRAAARSLVLSGACHLLYLVAPLALAPRLDYRHYYTVYCNLSEDCIQTANVLGITEKNAIRMITGKPITNVPEEVLRRFYLSLVLYDMYNQVPLAVIVDKYQMSRGSVQAAAASAAAAAHSLARFCGELPRLWAFAALFKELAPALQHCAAPDLALLMELPYVKKARAVQLQRAGFRRVQDVARAPPAALAAALPHLPRRAAALLVAAARMMLLEKVENLRAEAEEVMEELQM